MSDICHLYQFEKEARQGVGEFSYKNIEHIKYVFRDDRCRIITDDGNTHWFMGENRYVKWNKGRIYILGDTIYHSGYPIKQLKGTEE